MKPAVYVYVINVDWYFNLHWLQRARAVKGTGAVVHLVMGMTDKTIADKLTREGFICHPWNIDRKSINPAINLVRFKELYFLLRDLAPDVVHAITIKPNIFVSLLCSFLKTPYVMSITGTGFIFSSTSRSVRVFKPLIRMLYRIPKASSTARRIIFENQEDRAYFINTGLCNSEQAVTILGAGVDTELFIPKPVDNQSLPVLLFAARLLWSKGLGDLIEASKILQRRGVRFSFQVAGIVDRDTLDAIDVQVLEDWQQAGLIDWLGTVTDMPDLLARANIVVLPTFYGEGVPRILIEAAACARPIICTDIAGCREIVSDGENGLLVPARDITALATAIEKLVLAPALRDTMGLKGRQKVEQSFSEQQVIAKTMAVYHELT